MSQLEDKYSMSYQALFTGNHICIVKAKQLADSALRLLSDDENDLTHALGLYTLAIEEFGKAVFLKECFNDDADYDDPNSQKIPKDIFKGSKSHNLKFEKAEKNLPPECKNIPVGTRIIFPSGKPMRRRIGMKGPYASVPTDVSGNFFVQYTANFDVRMGCFYVDWDESEGRWIFNLKVERKDIESALNKFKEHIMNYDLVTIKQQKP